LFALFALGSVREILGEGKFFGMDLFGAHFEPWVIMILPPGGFLTLGLLLLFFSWVKERKEKLAERLAEMEGEPT
ncbi:MAG: electron transport complex subunit RsxE, partial [Chromatiaceae bacterium]|nr:electron transport complex subunit RsxE [Chromatiaceae bacterium]